MADIIVPVTQASPMPCVPNPSLPAFSPYPYPLHFKLRVSRDVVYNANSSSLNFNVQRSPPPLDHHPFEQRRPPPACDIDRWQQCQRDPSELYTRQREATGHAQVLPSPPPDYHLQFTATNCQQSYQHMTAAFARGINAEDYSNTANGRRQPR
ncbi:hypothetical protein CPC08DRAFT_771701 [Agrocybe pediades]|nr:hypothetical protein CPC08DRAFT_771701 [Agrocybe pediades]